MAKKPAFTWPLDLTPEQAFQLVRSEADALEEVLPLNYDTDEAIAKVLARMPGIVADEARVAKLPEFDLEAYRGIGVRVLAAVHVNALVAQRKTGGPDLPGMLVEVRKQRRILLSECRTLVEREVLTPESLAGFTASSGYKPVANDLIGLATLLKGLGEARPKAVTLEELDRAIADGMKLVAAAGAAELPAGGAQGEPELGDLVARVFTLLFASYKSVRRATTYFRYDDGDYDERAPSFYARGDGAAASTRAAEAKAAAEEKAAAELAAKQAAEKEAADKPAADATKKAGATEEGPGGGSPFSDG